MVDKFLLIMRKLLLILFSTLTMVSVFCSCEEEDAVEISIHEGYVEPYLKWGGPRSEVVKYSKNMSGTWLMLPASTNDVLMYKNKEYGIFIMYSFTKNKLVRVQETTGYDEEEYERFIQTLSDIYGTDWIYVPEKRAGYQYLVINNNQVMIESKIPEDTQSKIFINFYDATNNGLMDIFKILGYVHK